MGLEERLETVIVPRDYGFTVLDSRTRFKYFLFPERFVRADILLKTPGERRSQLRVFLANPENTAFLENLQTTDFASVEIALRKGIKGETGVYTLWRVRKEDVVKDYKCYENVLSGRVRAIRNGRIKGSYRDIRIGAPLRIASGILSDFYHSSSSDVAWSVVKEPGRMENEEDIAQASGLGKRVRVIDVYAATLLAEMAKRRNNPKFLPFYFFDRPDLEIRVMKAHYVDGVKYFDIDKGLMGLKEIINPKLVERTLAGKVTVEVLRQYTRKKACENEKMIEAEASLKRNLEANLRRQGSKRVGISLELKGTEYEALGIRWQRKGEICVPLFYDNLPPLVMNKKWPLERREAGFFYEETFGGNPLKSLDTYQLWLDDMTRQMMQCQITLPPVAIHPALKGAYIELIKANCPERANHLMEKFQLQN